MAAPRAGRREWAGLAVLALPTFLLAIDNGVLFLAVPAISEDLRPDATQLLWIMDSYGFMMAGFLVTMGTLGDRIGHRRLLMIGATAFGIASVLAAYAPTTELLIVGRVALGIAGATLMPATLALISHLFIDARQRAVAIAVWSSAFTAGAALGPVVGGALLEAFWWGAAFLIGLPVMVVLLVLAPPLLPASRPSATGRLDPLSVALSLAAILPVVYGLKELANDPGALAVVALVVGVGFGVVFVRRQRTLEHPLLDLSLFADRAFRGGLVILLAGTGAMVGLYLVISQYLQSIAEMTALEAGLWLVPGVLSTLVGSMLAPLVARRLRPGVVVAGGLAVSTVGYLMLVFTDPADGLALPMLGFILAMFGNGPLGALVIHMIVSAAPAGRAGSASSLAETGGEFGAALGVATFGSIAAAVYTGVLDGPGETVEATKAAAEDLPPTEAAGLLDASRDAFTAGLGAVTGVGAAVVAGLAVVALVALRHVGPTRNNHHEIELEKAPG